MRHRDATNTTTSDARLLSALVFALAFPMSASGLERWIPIAGTVGAFHTDVRILNPSSTKDIEVVARFFPAGNVNNSGVATAPGVSLAIPRREMRVLDDVTTLFGTTELGAIQLTSPDEFTASSRIYAQTASGTLGQSFTAEANSSATTSGTVLQLESTTAFRTNVGAVNVASASANVTFRLYDRSNELVRTATRTMPPFAVLAPTNIVTLFDAGSFDLSDAWISFTSTRPIFAYGSVVDNVTTDPTSIPAQHDTADTPAPLIRTSGAFFALNVVDLGASVQWYREKLGLAIALEVPAGGGFPAVTVLEGGGLIVELIHRTDAVPAGSTPRQGFTKSGIVVVDFDKVIAGLVDRGAEIAFGPFPASSTQPANAIIRDNAGNLIQIFGSGFPR